jgi:hypothetical protein
MGERVERVERNEMSKKKVVRKLNKNKPSILGIICM